MSIPAMPVITIATTTMSRKFRWIPGRFEANCPAATWIPSPPLTGEKWSEANQPIV
jgi:hypothetical protein